MSDKYIVAWTTKIEDGEHEDTLVDEYEVFKEETNLKNYENAHKKYKELLEKEETYSASLCKIMNSSDHF